MKKILSKKPKTKKEKLKNRWNKGITLIALVITIIVLLILAGVSIAMLTGDNGILTKATEAKNETEQAENDELKKLTQAEAATYLEEHEYIDINGEKVTIPAHCAVSQVKGENTLEDGLVVIDSNGNEWVWIEVPKEVTENSTTDEEIKKALNEYATEYRDNNYSDTWYEGCGLSKQDYNDRYSDILQGIKENGGFYIGRYEVGIKEDIYRYYGNDYATERPINETPVIQKNKYPYNWIRCSQAEKLSEKLSTDKNKCTLMFGIQWDLVLKYLETNGVSNNELKNDSSSWGNYSNVSFIINRGKYSTDKGKNYTEVQIGGYTKPETLVLFTTGATERNAKMNIYDLAGNVSEWTLGKSNIDNLSAIMGSNFGGPGYTYPVYFRDGYSAFSSYDGVGFRATLYL